MKRWIWRAQSICGQFDDDQTTTVIVLSISAAHMSRLQTPHPFHVTHVISPRNDVARPRDVSVSAKNILLVHYASRRYEASVADDDEPSQA